MKQCFLSVILLLVLSVGVAKDVGSTPSADQKALVYIEISSPGDVMHFASTGFPLYAALENGFLSRADGAGLQILTETGLLFRVIDPNLRSGAYYVAETHSSRADIDFTQYGRVLLKTSQGVLLRINPGQEDAIAQAGAELRRVTLTPKPIPDTQWNKVFSATIQPDPLIQGMIDEVTTNKVYQYDSELAGEIPVWVDNSWYTISSRYTSSGIPIQKATHYVGQHMQNLGLEVEYHNWGGNNYPNVIGQIDGLTNPNDIYIIGAHLDDVQGTPGADDNASGSVATLLAADILSQFQWGCTLRFAFWTGEEQGLDGSDAYAQRSYNLGENIIGYLNLDMIAWNTLGTDPYINLIYNNSLPPTQQLAYLYADVIDSYNLHLLTRFGTGITGSDHSSFWQYGYTSILAIEDDLGGDFNPYYHGNRDTSKNTDPAYFNDFVRASVATFAHMSNCLIRENKGILQGHVTDASNGTPLVGTIVTATPGSHSDLTDFAGYYSIVLPEGAYTATASLAGYFPESQTIMITPGELTTEDFALQLNCLPLTGLDFAWQPPVPFSTELITFSGFASGTQPINYAWDFGDATTSYGETSTHAFADPGLYHVMLSANNACSTAPPTSKEITIAKRLELFLPIVISK